MAVTSYVEALVECALALRKTYMRLGPAWKHPDCRHIAGGALTRLRAAGALTTGISAPTDEELREYNAQDAASGLTFFEHVAAQLRGWVVRQLPLTASNAQIRRQHAHLRQDPPDEHRGLCGVYLGNRRVVMRAPADTPRCRTCVSISTPLALDVDVD